MKRADVDLDHEVIAVLEVAEGPIGRRSTPSVGR
jgi:hypothetical protein